MSEKRLVFRPLTEGDIAPAIEIWLRAGISLTLSDRPEEIAKLLKRNPRSCIGGYLPESDRLVATALGTWDGRRANLWHLAVDPVHQGCGYGRAIMAELESIWLDMRVVKVSMFSAEETNRDVESFYNRLGYESRNDIFVISKILRDD
ncbi:MAG: GNAT family N-acetyltransferase [bacterium]|nr:GNAT family N-acetyltransferase [bacterium]